MYCSTNKFPELPFCGPYYKPHGARGFIKHYRFSFDPKLGNGIYKSFRIPFSCIACTSMLDKPCISGIPLKKRMLSTCQQVHLLASTRVIQ